MVLQTKAGEGSMAGSRSQYQAGDNSQAYCVAANQGCAGDEKSLYCICQSLIREYPKSAHIGITVIVCVCVTASPKWLGRGSVAIPVCSDASQKTLHIGQGAVWGWVLALCPRFPTGKKKIWCRL